MDLAMGIAASMDEIKRKHPEIDLLEHIRSGLRVGRAVVGTITTALLRADNSGAVHCLGRGATISRDTIPQDMGCFKSLSTTEPVSLIFI